MKKLLFVLTLLFVSACSRHGDLPPAFQVTEPPVPIDVKVETVDYMTFHVSWDVDDPAIVAYYQIYSALYSSPVLEDSTTLKSVQITTMIPLPDIAFCISTVTVENVESRLVCASAE